MNAEPDSYMERLRLSKQLPSRPCCRRCGWPLDIAYDSDSTAYRWSCNRPHVWYGDDLLRAYHRDLGDKAPPWNPSAVTQREESRQ